MKLISVISYLLQIPKNSYTSVMNTLETICKQPITYNGSRNAGQGKVSLIQHGTEQADIVYRAISSDLSVKDVTCILNMYRQNLPDPLDPISRSAVQGFMTRNDSIKIRKRQDKKSGKDDENSAWSKARLQQATQFKEQLRLGNLPVSHPDFISSSFNPIYSDGIIYWDEHHRQVILGNAGAYQYMISRNEDGVITTPADGGIFSEEKDRTSIKYPGEGRGCFGVAIVTRNGVKEGVRAVPFNYTGRKVISESAFQLVMNVEAARVLKLKGMWGGAVCGYKEKYGVHWEVMLRKSVDKTLCSIKDIVDHVITESERVYKFTLHGEDFRIFHDGLTVWWTKENQDYIELKGFKDRQLRGEGQTNKATRYENKVVGDSPEICRGLDAYGFADFKRCTERMRALTSVYAWSDPRRMKFGTPTEVMISNFELIINL